LQVVTDLIAELNKCREIYTMMGQDLASALADLQAGRFDSQSFAKVNHASSAPDSCDIQLFEGAAHKNPIYEENTDNKIRARLAEDTMKYIVDQRKVLKG
jgi:hypothetical protein